MAHMIPPVPKEFDEKSDEGIVFEALKKLPDDYYVFHSISINFVKDNKIIEREIDFVVVNQKKGILCLECKNGKYISYHDREWYYSSGKLMGHGGPFKQAETAKNTFVEQMKYNPNPDIKKILYRCKMMHAVWFFGITRKSFEFRNSKELPDSMLIELTMFAEDLGNPEKAINRIFSLDIPLDEVAKVKTQITEEELRLLLDTVLCPTFKLIPAPEADGLLIDWQMNQLLYEQYRLLDFLEDQRTAIINGAAGTGKTMLAVEKARRNSVEGERVLFLCFNRFLCDHLVATHQKNASKGYQKQFKNVDFRTISQLAKEKTGNFKDYEGLMNWLLECIDNPEEFGYKHVIVDEGQDFGLIDVTVEQDEAERNCSIIDALQDVAIEAGGTFYLFYDKFQMIQGGESVKYKLPDCITNGDCRLTLHYNCRNTKEIAQTSVTPLRDSRNRAIRPKVACSWFEPIKPVMHLVGSEKKAKKALDGILDKLQEANVDDVVILTPGTVDYSCIADELTPGTGDNTGYYLYQRNGIEYRLTTCIKFKGLEADAIVMIDLNKNSFAGFTGMEFYVGTSRAKHYLDFVAHIVPTEYKEVISALDPDAPVKNDPEMMRKVLGVIFEADVELA